MNNMISPNTLFVDDVNAMFLIFLGRDPEAEEGIQRGQEGPTDPFRIPSLVWFWQVLHDCNFDFS